MTCTRLDILVRQARDATGNQNYSTTQGIPQREFVKAANHAQERIYNKILQKRPSLFIKEGFLNATASSQSITLPTDVHLSHNIVSVEYSPTGNAKDYYPLDLRSLRQRVNVTGHPDSYVLRDGALLVSPIPPATVTNAFRLNYQYTLPELDLRRFEVTLTNSGSWLTQIALNTATGIQESLDDLADGWAEKVCLVGTDGSIAYSNIDVVSWYDPVTNIFTIDSGEIASVAVEARFLVFGERTTTHSPLPKVAERYLYTYMQLFAQLRDSNVEALDTNPILKAIEDEILDGVEMLEEDIVSIPILDYSYLTSTEDMD